jgi:hypothetical protein
MTFNMHCVLQTLRCAVTYVECKNTQCTFSMKYPVNYKPVVIFRLNKLLLFLLNKRFLKTCMVINVHNPFLSCFYSTRTLVACWIILCVKGLLPLNPLTFTHIHMDVSSSKLCAGLTLVNSVCHSVYTIKG